MGNRRLPDKPVQAGGIMPGFLRGDIQGAAFAERAQEEGQGSDKCKGGHKSASGIRIHGRPGLPARAVRDVRQESLGVYDALRLSRRARGVKHQRGGVFAEFRRSGSLSGSLFRVIQENETGFRVFQRLPVPQRVRGQDGYCPAVRQDVFQPFHRMLIIKGNADPAGPENRNESRRDILGIGKIDRRCCSPFKAASGQCVCRGSALLRQPAVRKDTVGILRGRFVREGFGVFDDSFMQQLHGMACSSPAFIRNNNLMDSA